MESEGELAAAAEAYLDCHVQYPDSDYGPPALFRSGANQRWAEIRQLPAAH